MNKSIARLSPRRLLPATVLLTLALAGCTPSDSVTRLDSDPFEEDNRRTHELNKRMDTNVLRPVSIAYVDNVPHEFRTLVYNFGENLKAPLDVINNVLQFRFGQAALNTARFVLNTTVGFGGAVDAASKFGIPWRDTDFGETLYVWGVPEGAYIEVPVFGPSTQRDVLGMIVDFGNSPLKWAGANVDPDLYTTGLIARQSGIVNERGESADSFDAVLYESADSYSQLRNIYLQNRRYQLAKNAGRDPASNASGDPYADPYAESYDDPYGESYDDPYLQ